MRGGRVAERADQDTTVHRLRQPRHRLADRDSWRGHGNRAELAADLLRGLMLGIPLIDRRWASRERYSHEPAANRWPPLGCTWPIASRSNGSLLICPAPTPFSVRPFRPRARDAQARPGSPTTLVSPIRHA